MTVILFLVPAVIFFWAFAYFFHNPDFVVENRALASGPLFAVGIAPLFLFYHQTTAERLPKLVVWVIGMMAGIGVAAFMYAELLDGWTP